MRHTAASLAIANGANVGVVQRMLGHVGPSITLNLYGHLFEASLDDIADRMDEAQRQYAPKSVPKIRLGGRPDVQNRCQVVAVTTAGRSVPGVSGALRRSGSGTSPGPPDPTRLR